MRTLAKLAVILLLAAICGAAPFLKQWLMQDGDSVRPSDLYEVVNNQLNAFRSSDYSRAYSEASYGIQQKFKRAQFEDMIRRDYAGVAQSDHVEFGVIRRHDRHALIQVFFIDREGGVSPCVYSLVHEGDDWKIDGARMLPRWPPGSRLEGLQT